ncbi:MAG: NAD-dependent epimerase/dehydratase family protein [Alkalinema sp. RU_4_3]|nr:NAD-dependent epimerase/dehydratase family protein [Alkalinema sp. RU_4_3]
MKALVTGANGFTGSHLVQALLDRGDQVTAYVRRGSDHSRLPTHSALTYAYGDITDETALTTAMQGIDTVFHIAAYVELGLVNVDRMRTVNVEGTRTVIAAMEKAGVQNLLYCSTIGIYGDTQGKTIDETFQRQQVGFSSAYDETKFAAQLLVNQAASRLRVVSVMPSGIFGPGDPHFGPVVESFRKGKLKVWAGGDRITGIVHVDDLVDGMLRAIDRAASGGMYILSAGDLSTREMFEIFSQASGVRPPYEAPKVVVRIVANLLDGIGRIVRWQPPIDRERAHYVYDRCVRVSGQKAMTELGWQPRSPRQTLKELL